MRYDTATKELIERWNEINFQLIEAEGEELEALQDELADVEAQLEYNGVSTDDLLLDQEAGVFDDIYEGDSRE